MPTSPDATNLTSPSEVPEKSSEVSAEKRPGEELPTEQENDAPKKKRKRGQNKQRAKFSDQRVAQGERLCKAILCDSECGYGEKCKFSHDIAGFISKKPPDLPGQCYNFMQSGKCPYGFACRFGKTHIEEKDGKYINLVNEKVEPVNKSVNHLSKENLVLLRKHQYDFSKAIDAAAQARAAVDKIAKRNRELHCVKKVKKVGNDDVAEEPTSQAMPATDLLDENSGSAPTTGVPEGSLGISKVAETEEHSVSSLGPLTNEDEFTVKPGEKKTIDFKNKLYLAPLTTVSGLCCCVCYIFKIMLCINQLRVVQLYGSSYFSFHLHYSFLISYRANFCTFEF